MKPLAALILTLGLWTIALGLIWSQPLVTRCGATALVAGVALGQVPQRKAKAKAQPLPGTPEFDRQTEDYVRRFTPMYAAAERTAAEAAAAPPEPQAVS